MSSLLVALVGVLLLPLFAGNWRVSLVGLGLQGWLMGWVSLHSAHGHLDAAGVVSLVDLFGVRGVLVPWLLWRAQRGRRAPSRNDVIPPNLFSWAVALGVVLAAHAHAPALVPEAGDAQRLVAVSASGLCLGFLVLATQAAPFGQIVGVLRVENAVALLELGGAHPAEDAVAALVVRLGQLAVVVVSVGLYAGYLRTIGEAEATPPDASPAEEAVL